MPNRALIAAAIVLGSTVLVAAPPQLAGSLVGRQVFPVSNWWNLDISRAPIDPASSAYINFIGRTRQVHPDFGPPPYGIPYIVVSGDQPLVAPTWTAYGDESDAGAPGRPAGYPIPSEAKTQANYIEGGVAGGGLTGDRHMLIVDQDHWLLYETAGTHWNAAANRWEADCGAVFDLNRNDRAPRRGRPPMRPGWRSFPVSSGTTKRMTQQRSGTHSASPCVPRTATSGPPRIARDRQRAHCRWAPGCG